MTINSITYKNFRNIPEATLNLSPEVNILCGSNAQGKTNALEGIYIFAQGRSFRTPREKELITFGEKKTELTLEFSSDKDDRARELEISFTSDGRRSCAKNGVKLSKMSEFIGNFRAVLFCPYHLSLVSEGPSVRRAFVDVALSQLDHIYLRTLQDYAQILKNRNIMLAEWDKLSPGAKETLEVWDAKLACEAARTSRFRDKYIRELDGYVREIFADMTNSREVPRLEYKKLYTEREYDELIKNSREREIRMGTTLVGAHRDDIAIYLNDRDARSYASQGQQRSLALAMKLAEGMISKKTTGEEPVLLLDDILSELDAERREYVLRGLEGRQVIITACDESLFERREGRIWRVSGGEYTEGVRN